MLLKKFLLNSSPISAIILGSVVLSASFTSPIQAMDAEIIQLAHSRFSSKDQLEAIADSIDTIVIGGIRRKQAAAHHILSGPNCLTINTDKASDPDFLADGFSQKLAQEIPILFDVFGKNGKHFGKIKKIIYEHVGLGIDVEKPDAFIALNSLLSSGGTFEYMSFWEYASYSSYALAATEPDSNITFLNQGLRFKTSYLNHIVHYDPQALERAERLKAELQEIEKMEIANATSILKNEQSTKEQKYIDLVCFQKDNPASLWKSKAYLKKHKEYMNFVIAMKSTAPTQIKGLDDHMENFFRNNPEKPYVIDLEKDKEFFCQSSLLETNPRFFQEILGLKNVEASFRKKTPSQVMCFSVIGIKKD